MHRIALLSLAAFCILLAAAVSPAHAQYTLEYKFEKGHTYRFGDSTTVVTSTERMGQEVQSQSTLVSTTKLLATDVTAGKSAVIEVSPEAMRIALKAGPVDTTIVPTELIGKRTRITLSNLGTVTKREILDTVKMAGMLGGMGQREVVRFHIYPDKTVKIGDKWDASRADSTSAMGGTMVTASKLQYTVAAKEKKAGRETLKLTYAGTMSVAGQGSMMGMQVYVEGSGKVKGFCFVDPATGLPVYDESVSDMATTAAITGQQNMTIPSSQSVVSRRTLLGQ